MKRLRNTSGIPDATVKQVANFVADELGIAGFDVECRASSAVVAGRAYSHGSSYHSNARPFVVLRVGSAIRKNKTQRFPTTIEPYQYAHHKGKKYVLANRIEALVYLTAHELRHLWQAAQHMDSRKSASLPRSYGSRGKFSEIDTEAYAIHTLRRWRKVTA